jgi:metal-dependent amidase/aminoacylase/carboxypeptidase family protein
MQPIPEIQSNLASLTALRHEIHRHPELAFEEQRTADHVAAWLTRLGIEVHRGLATTGVVGVLRAGKSSRAIGLRADMDALPIQEQNPYPHRSVHDGKMHACGHDGHTTMLLGAAEYLARTRQFDGTVYFIFQPAEETVGGARVMIEEGLLERFPMDSIYGMHNWPGLPAGQFAVHAGPVMACADQFDIVVRGHGAHAAMPQQGRDPLLAGAALVQSLQASSAAMSIRSTRRCCRSPASHAGDAYNVIPDEAGSAAPCAPSARRWRTPSKRPWNASAPASAPPTACRRPWITGAAIRPPSIPRRSGSAASRCSPDLVGAAQVRTEHESLHGRRGLSPTCCVRNPVATSGSATAWREGGCMLHNPRYDFNDAILPLGASYWVRLTEALLSRL